MGLKFSIIKEYAIVQASNHPAFPGKNALILLYVVANHNHRNGIKNKHPKTIKIIAKAKFISSNKIPNPKREKNTIDTKKILKK